MSTKIKQIRVDGYKNLFNCTVDLNDFNVLVGPNNSGKTNLIEAVLMLTPIVSLSESNPEEALSGTLVKRLTFASSVSHLASHANAPFTLGICFEMNFEKKKWIVDYEVKIQCNDSGKIKSGFLHEKLKAKPKSQRGPYITYFARTPEKLTVNKKVFPIPRGTSALNAIQTLFPVPHSLPKVFIWSLMQLTYIGLVPIFAINPNSIRNDIDSNIDISKGLFFWRISDFDPLLIIDEIKEEGKNYDIFTETLCQVLDLGDVNFVAHDIEAPKTSSNKKPASKRMRLMTIKRKGNDYVNVEEFSDGTLAVIALLAGILSPKRFSPVVFIEELENFLHPAAISKLLQFLQEHSSECQVVITTHSPYLLNAVKPEDVNVAVVDDTGASHFEKLTNRKKIEDRLKHGYMSFGDLLVDNYNEIIND